MFALSRSNLQTSILFVATVSIVLYSLFCEHPKDAAEDLIDYEAMEEELDSANPVLIVPYKSPLDERLFIPWPPGVSYDPFAEESTFIRKSQDDHCHKKLRSSGRAEKFSKIWKSADHQITRRGLWNPNDSTVQAIMEAMATACLIKVDLLEKDDYESGTGEKWIGTLEGGQKVVIKIVWEAKGDMKRGALCNDGYEMPTSEIAAYHLHKILGFYNTPFVIGRTFDLVKDILPYASPSVAKQITLETSKAGNEACLTGRCVNCVYNHTICPRDNLIEVSMAYWIGRRLKLHSFPDDFMPFSSGRNKKWETIGFNDKSYCKEIRQTIPAYSDAKMYLDLFDFSILDTLMHHFDSKHYTINDDSSAHGLTVRLDHGRAFCSYESFEEEVFMAPINQCCKLRRSTYNNLLKLRDGKLSKLLRASLANDPISPVLKSAWYPVLDKRLQIILELIENCFKANGADKVLV